MTEEHVTLDQVRPCGCSGESLCPQHWQALPRPERGRRALAQRREREQAECDASDAQEG